jgi:hypothetical protein
LDGSETVIQSAPKEQLVASSTVDIAGTLSASRSRWQSYKVLLAILAALCVAAAFAVARTATVVSPTALFLFAAGAVIILGAVAVHGLRSSTVSLDYDLSSETLDRFKALGQAFDDLARCSRIWRLPLSKKTDWKRSGGSSEGVDRQLVAVRRANLPLLKTNVEYLQLPLGKETLYFTPDAILVVAGSAVAAFHYDEIDIHCGSTRFVEDGAAPSDAQVVAETWQFVNRSGGPDRRFNNNRKLPICLYGEIDFSSTTGLNERILCTRVDASEAFVAAVAAMRHTIYASHGVSIASPPPILPTPRNNDRNSTTTDVQAAYARETEIARSLALNHGKFWEYLLVQELLDAKLQVFKHECEHISDLEKTNPRLRFSGPEFVKWIGENQRLGSATEQIIATLDKRLREAMGEPGVLGDAVKILNEVNSLFENCRSFLVFEAKMGAAEVPPAYSRLKGAFSGITLCILHMLDDLSVQWNQNVNAIRNGSQKFELKAHLDPLPQLAAAAEEFDKIRRHPEQFRE